MAASAPKNRFKATAWGAEHLIDLEMPSGQLAQVRRPGVTGLIKAGLLDGLDTLTSLVKTEHIDRVKKGEGGPAKAVTSEDVKLLSQDTGRLLKALDLMDSITEYVVVQPFVLRPVERDDDGKPVLIWKGKLEEDGSQIMEEIPLADDKRALGQIYTDSIDPTDKVYLFQFVVGGVRDLEQFRQEFGETLGNLESL